ncbi:LCP family protein [bacterium]|nr:LCP family protein [bacterium]NCQ55339.1 LCP family protein [Candidatus Parcubacteria bacterium]NCS67148.1 LCP family protein [Candidatus Peregrinibacteria bacterium]NCS96774.1 LCP family protein [bacterium]
MSFKVKKIRENKGKFAWWLNFQDAVGPKLAKGILMAIPLSVLCLVGVAMLQAGWMSGDGPVRIIPKFTALEQTDGHTNMVFLGVAGRNEQGGNLSDSIILLSINGAKGTVSMLSLPRDLYIDSQVGSRKINEIYANASYGDRYENGIKVVKEAFSNFTGIPIHYAAVIDFKVFEQMVDELGGVKVFVAEDIVDPYYPDVNYGYQTFIVRKGIQEFDGEMALKYARSRKTSSDYSRAKRQQDLLFAIKEKAKESGALFNPNQLRSFYQTFSENVVTDMGLPQLLELGKIAAGVDYDGLVSAVLNDDPSNRGGLLYAPAREFYNGQFILLPLNLKDTQKFIELTLITPEILLENAQMAVLNASSVSGLANQVAQRLRRLGFHVIETGNYDSETPVTQSFYNRISSNETPLTETFLQNYFGFVPMTVQAPEEPTTENEAVETTPEIVNLIDMNIVLGSTYTSPQ